MNEMRELTDAELEIVGGGSWALAILKGLEGAIGGALIGGVPGALIGAGLGVIEGASD